MKINKTLFALGHTVKERERHIDSKVICGEKARDMLGTWAKHGAAKMGGASMKLHGSIQGGYSSLLRVSGYLETFRGVRTNEEMIASVQVEKTRSELGWGQEYRQKVKVGEAADRLVTGSESRMPSLFVSWADGILRRNSRLSGEKRIVEPNFAQVK